MNRTSVRVRRRRLGVLGTLGAVVAIVACRPHPAQPLGRAIAAHRYVVHAGDTIWGIATRLSPGGDPRPLVDAISAANHVDPGSLTPGETLVIPSA